MKRLLKLANQVTKWTVRGLAFGFGFALAGLILRLLVVSLFLR